MKADECPGGDMIMALRARVSELEAALEPFSKAAEKATLLSNDWSLKLNYGDSGITVGHLRAARRALGR